MDTSNEEEVMPLIRDHVISATIRDNRRPYEKHLAVYLILASIMLEGVAFYSLDLNLSNALSSNTTFHCCRCF